LASHGEAIAAICATLETLGERLAGGAADKLAAELPQEIGEYLRNATPVDVYGDSFGLDDFFQRRSLREGKDLPLATYHARVVIEVLQEAVSAGAIEKSSPSCQRIMCRCSRRAVWAKWSGGAELKNGKHSNREIARVLEEIADRLEAQKANPFRVQAYRNAAQVVRSFERDIADMVRDGQTEQLRALPQIGEGISALIAEYVTEGRSETLDRLRNEVPAEAIFSQVPGIGETLARRIVRELHVDTLEDLERAVNDGRLERVEGFGEKRLKTVRAGLAGMLRRGGRRRVAESTRTNGDETTRPSIDAILEVDAEYRRLAKRGELRKIAPRRFNPSHRAWLPVWGTEREGWKFTAMFSNTAQAHELGKTHDWVVIYYKKKDKENQVTVVTPSSGTLKGKRVVRGREVESARYYERQKQ